MLLRLLAGGRAFLDRRAEQVPGGDVHEAVLLDDELAPVPLPRRARQRSSTRLGPALTVMARRPCARGAGARRESSLAPAN